MLENANQPQIEVSETHLEVSNSLATYVNQFKCLRKETATSIVALGAIVYQAKSNLSKEDYIQFASEVQISNSSTLRKYERIGQCEVMFNLYLDHLPHTWTSLYALTRLDENKLISVFNEGKIHPQITGEEVEKLIQSLTDTLPSSNLNKDTKDKSVDTQAKEAADNSYTLSIKFDSTPSFTVVEELQQLIKQFFQRKDTQVQFSLSQLLQSLLQHSQQTVESVA